VSLRARLLIGLVVLTAVGLLVAGFATYRAERSFLYDRIDGQLLASVGPIESQIDAGAQPGRAGAPAGVTGAGARGTAPPGNLPGGGAGLPIEGLSDPRGTFGEYLNAKGKVVGTAVGDNNSYLAPPKLPARYPRTSDLRHPHIFTASAIGDPGLHYRVLADASHSGAGTTIVAVALTDVDASLTRLQQVEAIVIASVLLAVALGAWLLIRIGLRPLDRIGETAGAIAAGDLSRRVSPAEGRTEVGRLGLALNAMLGQIEQAFATRQASEERLRRFLSDASHELRTPLTSIRGYAELFRLGATARPADTAKAMARIEEEAARMGVLVEELLALARLDEMPQTIREPVDLAPLVTDAGDDARAIAPDRELTVSIDPPPRGAMSEHVVSGDQHQLRQVLANLTANALTHTPAGSPIELRLRSRDGRARIEVRDHGGGLPQDSGDAVFERFWRAEPGRERGKAGAGLGLAIVAEIVAAHGGQIAAHNAPDGGASFVIELPLAAEPPPAA
jgi:two-component system OmpR family sensor kinase